MDTFDHPAWIAACFTAGIACLLLGAWHVIGAFRGASDTPVARPFSRRLTRALRAVLSGLCLLGIGHGLNIGSVGWTVTCLAIGLEELYETTMALSVLGWCERVAAADAHSA